MFWTDKTATWGESRTVQTVRLTRELCSGDCSEIGQRWRLRFLTRSLLCERKFLPVLWTHKCLCCGRISVYLLQHDGRESSKTVLICAHGKQFCLFWRAPTRANWSLSRKRCVRESLGNLCVWSVRPSSLLRFWPISQGHQPMLAFEKHIYMQAGVSNVSSTLLGTTPTNEDCLPRVLLSTAATLGCWRLGDIKVLMSLRLHSTFTSSVELLWGKRQGFLWVLKWWVPLLPNGMPSHGKPSFSDGGCRQQGQHARFLVIA